MLGIKLPGVLTVAKGIAELGLEKFCETPQALAVKADVPGVCAAAQETLGVELAVRALPGNSMRIVVRRAKTGKDGFEAEFGGGVLARLGLLLVLFCERTERGESALFLTAQHDEQAARLFGLSERKTQRSSDARTFHPRFATLVGLDSDQPIESLKWWIDSFEIKSPTDSFIVVNGIRYGLFYPLFHELAHVMRGHFDGLAQLPDTLTDDQKQTVRLGMECDADFVAMQSLLVYIQHTVNNMAKSAPDGVFGPEAICAARGHEFRAALYGIFAVFSCLNPLQWTNLDFLKTNYLHQVTRIGLAVKNMDLIGLRPDGRLTFDCFPQVLNVADDLPEIGEMLFGRLIVPGGGKNLRWDWSSFLGFALMEWDGEAAGFLFDCQKRFDLPVSPYPFNIQRRGLDLTEETFERAKQASIMAEPHIDKALKIIVTGEAFHRYFG